MFPEKLKIGAHTFTIELKDMADDCGSTDFDTGVISIHSKLIPTLKWSTLIHEVCHVMNPTMDSTQDGHRILEALSEQLYQVLADNNLLR